MSLTFINENLTAIGMMAFQKTSQPIWSNPIKHRLLGFLTEVTHTTQPAAPLKKIATQPVPPKDYTSLFIYLMEKALIGSLVSLWIMAALVVLNTLYTLIF